MPPMGIEFTKRLSADVRGTSAVEVGIICAVIVLAMFGAVQGFADQANVMWTDVNSKVEEASN